MTALAGRLRRTRSVPYSPSGLPGLVGWYDATTIAGPPSDGAAVATWADISGNGKDLTQGVGGSQPTYKTAIQNGRPVVRFDGTADHLFRTDALVASPGDLSVVVAMRLGASTTTGQCPTAQRRSSNVNPITAEIRIDPSGRWVHDWRNDAGALVSATTGLIVAANTAYVISGALSGTTLSTRSNGSVGTSNATIGGGANTLDRTSVGAAVANTVTAYFNGDLCEVLIFNRALAVAELVSLERHLGAKWGISVA